MPPPGDGFGGYPAQPYDQFAAQDEQLQQPYEDPAAAQQPHDQGHKKKKRGYAAQAFEVGTGANAVAGGQPAGATQQFGAAPAQPGYGGYQAEPQAAAPQGYQYPQGYGAQQPAAPQVPQYGYQAPDQGYPTPGAPQPAPGVGGITQGVGSMNIAGQPQGAQPPRPAVLNQLYPTDLLSQPFNVSELDLPPPPIVLPANVSRPNEWIPAMSIANMRL
jgi:protein transport protein SEC24